MSLGIETGLILKLRTSQRSRFAYSTFIVNIILQEGRITIRDSEVGSYLNASIILYMRMAQSIDGEF